MIQNHRSHYFYWVSAAITVLLLLLWLGFIQDLLGTNGFIPHGHCYLWRPSLVWLHVSSDVLIGLAYVAISATLAYLVQQTRREIPFHWMFLAFGLFIVACGMTHFMEVWTLWHPVYWLSGDIKLVTAIASVTTALALPPLVPQAYALLQAAKTSEERRVQLEMVNQELESLYCRVKELDQAKTQFFSNVSHELRTPLALILGPTDKLLSSDELTHNQRYSLELISRSAHGLLRQVNDLLDIAKLDMGKMDLHYSNVDLAQLVRLTAAQFETIADDQQIHFSVETPTDLLGQVDSKKLQQVLLNLLSNAFKFTPAHGRILCTLECSTTPATATAAQAQTALLTVQDSGPGVPVELREAIFDRFYSRPGGDTSRFGSTGLGLTIVKDLVELHRGCVSVSDVPDGGACFTVELPLLAPPGSAIQATIAATLDLPAPRLDEFQDPLPPPVTATPTPEANQDKALVLVIEDNPDMGWFITDTLAASYRIVRAMNGQEGLEKAIALQPDLILSDVMMPILDGEQLVQKLRAHPELEQIPIILLTAKADLRLRVALLQQGVQDYLTKPFSAEELCARVGNLIAMKQVRQVLQKELATQSQDLAGLANELSLRNQELQTALAALQISESRFRQAILYAPFPVVIHAEDGSIVAISHALTAMTGYTHDELKTISDWTERAYPERKAQVDDAIQHLYTLRDRQDEGEYVITTMTGEQRTWDFSSAPIGQMPDGRRLIISMARDVTERKQLEQTLRQQTEELAHANRMKDEFLATLSHELRTPMNAILGWSKLLRTREFDVNTTSRALETIERNARQQSQLIEDLLEISRIVQGKLRLNTEPVDLAPIIDAAIEAVRPGAEAKAIQLEFDDSSSKSAALQVLGDADRLQQIVWNLLSNAVKFTFENGRVEIGLEWRDGRRGNEEDREDGEVSTSTASPAYAQIAVTDTGIGIKSDFLPYVFDRFRQADSSMARSYNGLGLGLAIVRHLVELHGGTVWAESLGEGQGSTFIVRLPLLRLTTPKSDEIDTRAANQLPGTLGSESKQPAHTSRLALPALLTNPAAPLPLTNLPLAGLKALVVDDDPDTQAYLIAALSHSGMTVTAVNSAREAISHLHQSNAADSGPDILISDIGMPIEDGYALIRQVRSLEPVQGGQIPAIALTAYASDSDRQRVTLAGYQLHLAKPVEPLSLITAVATLLGLSIHQAP